MILEIDDGKLKELRAALGAGARDARKWEDQRVLRELLDVVSLGLPGWARVVDRALAPAPAGESLDDLILHAVREESSKTEIVRALGSLAAYTHAEVNARFDELKGSGVIVESSRGSYVVRQDREGE